MEIKFSVHFFCIDYNWIVCSHIPLMSHSLIFCWPCIFILSPTTGWRKQGWLYWSHYWIFWGDWPLSIFYLPLVLPSWGHGSYCASFFSVYHKVWYNWVLSFCRLLIPWCASMLMGRSMTPNVFFFLRKRMIMCLIASSQRSR